MRTAFAILLLLLPSVFLNALAQTSVIPSPRGKYVTVGAPSGTLTYGFNPLTNLTQWVQSLGKVYAGDVLLFKYPSFAEEVYLFGRAVDFANCNYLGATVSRVCSDTQGLGNGCAYRVRVGTYMFGAGFRGHCELGQKFVLRVVARPYTPKVVRVGYPSKAFNWGWNVNGRFTDWTKYNTIYAGDKLVFQYPANRDEVYMVPKGDYNLCKYNHYYSYCNATDGTGAGCFTPPLEQKPYYFVSGSFAHCSAGQKVAVSVLAPPVE